MNTGNEKYEFKLSIPFNDFNSILWWKPDEKEELVEEEQTNPEGYTPPEEPEKKYRYYKAYETERFLRWFGSNYIPMFDKETIYKKAICSIPVLSNDVQSDKFYNDSNNLMNNPDMAIKAFTALKEEREKNRQLMEDNQRMKPKEIFADAVSASHTSILIGGSC